MKHLGFDCSYFCWRGFHGAGNMRHDGMGTGAISSVLTSIFYHSKQFGLSSPLFTFDSRRNFRKAIDPGYKLRIPKDDKEKEDRLEIFKQIKALRKDILPTIGFKNIYQQTGLEADDIMARLVRDNPNEIILLTADEDLLQVVDDCSWYSPHTKVLMNEKRFTNKYNILPRDWRVVKQLVGCSSDKVKGIHMVGEKTAIKYLNGTLNKKTVAYQIIDAEKRDMRRKNGILVNLPHPKTSSEIIRENEFSPEGFLLVCEIYGLNRLASKVDEWRMLFS